MCLCGQLAPRGQEREEGLGEEESQSRQICESESSLSGGWTAVLMTVSTPSSVCRNDGKMRMSG